MNTIFFFFRARPDFTSKSSLSRQKKQTSRTEKLVFLGKMANLLVYADLPPKTHPLPFDLAAWRQCGKGEIFENVAIVIVFHPETNYHS